MDKYERRRQRLLFLKKQFCQNKISILADRLDRPHSYVSRMLYAEGKAHKRRIGDDMLEHIAQTFDVSKAWVDGLDDGVMFESTLQIKFAAEWGNESVRSPSWLKSIGISVEEARLQGGMGSVDDICLLAPFDDCMSPTIPRQSIVLMDGSITQFVGNGVYCLRLGNFITFRRMQQCPNGKIKVTSDNRLFREGEFEYDLAEPVQGMVCGQLLKVLPLLFRDL